MLALFTLQCFGIQPHERLYGRAGSEDRSRLELMGDAYSSFESRASIFLLM